MISIGQEYMSLSIYFFQNAVGKSFQSIGTCKYIWFSTAQ